MNTKELQELIRSLKYGEQALTACVDDGYLTLDMDCDEDTELLNSIIDPDKDIENGWVSPEVYLQQYIPTFTWLFGERDYSNYMWRFSVDGKIYEIPGWYDSYNGRDCDNVTYFYRVEAATKLVTYYKKASDE